MGTAWKHAIFALALLPAGMPLGAAAQDYPAREIRSICNFSAGSGADILGIQLAGLIMTIDVREMT